MTVLVGVLCRDGVVVGSDSSATFTAGSFHTVEQPATKLFVPNGQCIVAGTGQVGLGQRFVEIVTRIQAMDDFQRADRFSCVRTLCTNAIQDLLQTQARRGEYGALVGLYAEQKFHLCEFATTDFQPEFKTEDAWFVSMGSGQAIADPFLGLLRRVFFDGKMPSRREGIFAVLWTLRHAIELNTGGIQGPARIAEMFKDGGKPTARMLTEDELTEHHDNIDAAEKYVAKYRDQLAGKKNAEAIPTPSPPVPPPKLT